MTKNNTKKMYMINASAGTGKTYTLTHNIIKDLEDPSLDVKNILATTFTKKAASELRQRLRKLLLSEGKKDLAAKILNGKIGTVNSIFGQLVKDNAIDVGISPALEVIGEDDDDQKYVFDKATVEIFDLKLYKKADEIAKSLSLNYEKTTPYSKGWKDDVYDLVLKLYQNKITEEEDIDKCKKQSLDAFSNLLLKKEQRIKISDFVQNVNRLSNFAGSLKKKELVILQNSSECMNFSTEDWKNYIKVFSDKKLEENKNGSDYIKLHDALLNFYKTDKFIDELEGKVKNYITLTFDTAKKCIKLYNQYKKDHGLMDFADQEILSYSLLKNTNSSIENIKNLYVDEFQDTNPIQLALYAEMNKQDQIQKTKFVGDPKQSIYGFRGSDVQLTELVNKNILPENNTTLSYCYRSCSEIVDFVNKTFKTKFGKDYSLVSIPDKEYCQEHKKFYDKVRADAIEIWNVSTEKSDELKEKNIEVKYNRVVKGIKDLLNSDFQVYDEVLKEFRHVQGKDIAVLIDKNDEIDKFAKEASQYIKVNYTGLDLMSSPICQMVYALMMLKVVYANPLMQSNVQFLLDKFDTTKYEKDEDLIATLKEIKNNQTVLDLFEKIISTSYCQELLEKSDNIKEEYANLDMFKGLILKYQDLCTAEYLPYTLEGFILWKDDNENLFKCPPSFDNDAINVMTTHKAKGLEWPIVILLSANKHKNDLSRSLGVIAVSDFGKVDLENPLKDRKVIFYPNFSKIVKEDSLDADECLKLYKIQEDEYDRKMYVAYTRAKEKLILCKFDDNELYYAEEVSAVSEKSEILGENDFIKNTLLPYSMPKTKSEKQKCLPLNVAPSEDVKKENLAFKIEQENNEQSGFDVVEIGKFETGIEKSSEEFGDVMHLLLSSEPKTDDAKDVITQIVSGTKLSPEIALKIKTNFEKKIQEETKCEEFYRELPFDYKENGQIVTGFIDMVAMRDDGFFIVDHKTISPSHNEDIQSYCKKYKKQLRLYAYIVQKMTGKSCLGCIINLPIQGMFLKFDFCKNT